MPQSEMAWKLLCESVGSFEGHGINHEGENFTGTASLSLTLPGKLLAVQSKAIGEKGQNFHEEHSWIGRGPGGGLTLFVSSNNHPFVTPHLFERIEEGPGVKNVYFRFGNIEDEGTFREEIRFGIYTDGSLEHQYFWGLPGGKFEPRSGSRMARK